MALDATVGGASANSLASLAAATAFLATTFAGAAWDDGNDDLNEVCLIEASSVIHLLPFGGERSSATQALEVPRRYMLDKDSITNDYFAPDVIPVRIFKATCRLAAIFKEAGRNTIGSEDTKSNVVRSKVDVLETEYAHPTERVRGLARYPSVWDEISPLLEDLVGANQIRLVRG